MTIARPTGRNAARTQKAILDAAEELFADRGYRAATLQEIGHAAGVSRGTPGYFFGSKEQLYQAVVERMLGRSDAFFTRRDEAGAGTSDGAEGALATVVSSYLDFLTSEPTFVRLMHSEAVGNTNAAGRRALEIIRDQLSRAGIEADDSAELAVAVAALSCFPLAHADAVESTIGVDPWREETVAAHKRWMSRVLSSAVGAGAPDGMADGR